MGNEDLMSLSGGCDFSWH